MVYFQYYENSPTAEAIKVLMDMFHMRSCSVNNPFTGSVGDSHAIHMMISDISNARIQMFEY